MDEYRDCEIKEIAEQYIQDIPQISEIAVAPDETNRPTRVESVGTEDVTLTEGIVTYDIRFKATAPVSGDLIRLIINIETQNDFYPGYPLVKRGIYYCSRMISAQYGTEFTESHYEDIKKVYSIWICANPPKNRGNTITRYSIKEDNMVGDVKEKPEHYDLMTTIMICLGEEEDEKYQGILKLLEVLLSSEKDPEEKKKVLKTDFNIPVTQDLESEVTQMCNLSKGVEEKGIQKGIQQGTQETLLLSIRNLMDSMGWTIDEAMTALKITEPKRTEYMEALKEKH